MLTDSSSRIRDLPFDLQTRILAAHAAQLPVDGAVFTARSVARLVVGPDLDDPAYDAGYEPVCTRAGLKTAVCGTWRATYRQLAYELEGEVGRRRECHGAADTVAVLERPHNLCGHWHGLAYDACRKNRTLLLRILVGEGVVGDDSPRFQGGSPAWYLTHVLGDAVEEHNIDAVRLLLDAGADVCGRHTCLQNGPLIVAYAAQHGALAEMEALLDAGAPLHDNDEVGYAPLAEAAFAGVVQATRRLLERGADPHRLDLEGRTPLIRACETSRTLIDPEARKLKVVRMLLDAGVDPEARARDDRQAINVARESGFFKIVEVLAFYNVDEWIAEEEELAADVRAVFGGDEIIREEV